MEFNGLRAIAEELLANRNLTRLGKNRPRLELGIRRFDRRTRLCRKLDRERRALAELALNFDRAAVALHDTETHGEPQAGAADFRLGREERLEDAMHVV